MKLGLSLCGGGSKGAYELGVWDALREYNLEFDIVTGSSIGALNSAMYVQGDYETALSLWNSVEITNVIENGFDIEEMNVAKLIKNEDFKDFFKKSVKSLGTNIEPFKELLHNYLNFEKIRNSKVLYGITVTQIPLIKKEILVNELNDEDMYNYILASCSMFPFFPMVEINDKKYVDGGFSDNLPIDFAFKLGATRVIAVDLNPKITHQEYLNNPYVDYIYPKYDLGSFLHFNKNVTAKNRKLGYFDTCKHFGKYEGFKYTFKIDRSFQEYARVTTLSILNDSITFKSSQEGSLIKKTGDKDVFNYLNKHIHRKIQDYDYFLKCLEEICAIFQIDPTVLYDQKILIAEFNKHFYETDVANITSNIINEFAHLKSVFKKKDYLENCDQKKLLAFFYHTKVSSNFKIFLFDNNIELYLALVFIETIRPKKELGNDYEM